MNAINIGIVGCASVVQKHIIKAFHNVKNGKIVAIASRNSSKAKTWSKDFNCEYEESYDDVLKRSDINAVYIPLPIGLHKEWVIKAAKAKKHIMCEKSLAESFASVKEITHACKKNHVILYENFMCGYHPQHHKVISIISDGEIGDISLFNGFFGFPPLDEENFRYKHSLGGGALNDAGAYPIFMSRKILKSEPLYATCNLVYDKKHEVETQGSAYLEYPKNKVALIGFGFDNMYQNNYSIWGSTGLIKVNRAYSIPESMKPQVELIKQDLTEKIDAPSANQFTLIFDDFCNRVLEDKYNEFDYSSLVSQARVMEALRISAKENRKVEVKSII